MANWIVELEPGVYLAPTEGDPGRTLRRENATVFASHPRARSALIEARRFRPFADGRVTLAPLVEPPNAPLEAAAGNEDEETPTCPKTPNVKQPTQ